MAISRSHERMHVKIDCWCSSSNVMHDVHVVLALSTRPFINASGCVRACISRAPGAALARVRPAASPRAHSETGARRTPYVGQYGALPDAGCAGAFAGRAGVRGPVRRPMSAQL